MICQEEPQVSDEQQWVRVIASTRLVRLSGDDYMTRFTRNALDDAAKQINHAPFFPLLYEHLRFMPPIGQANVATVREAEDGEAELCISGTDIKNYLVDYRPSISQLYASSPKAALPEILIKLEYDRRNFDDHVTTEIHEDIGDIARPRERWSELPPLEYAIIIPVVWGAVKFAGSFFEELGRIAGKALASKISSWTRKSKQPNRTIVFALTFELSNGSRLCGYVLASPDNVETAINSALKASEELALIAGVQNETNIFPLANNASLKEAAFFLDEDYWRLGWWTDGENVFYTPWFEENPPDIDGVLGRSA